MQVYPDAARKQARVRVVVGNITGQPATGKLAVNCRSYNVATPADFAAQSVEVQAPDARNVVEFIYQPGETVPLWDEFQPAMLRLDLQLATTAGGQSFADQRAVSFGLRDFKRDGQRLAINGRTVFLRGRLDCANYPLTGYPPMDKDGWLRVLGILKDWGLNHVRFHSWCPPEAAFVAADELGMYFQVELPNKRSAFKVPESTDAPKRNIDYLDVPGADPNASLYDYALREGELIFRHFGNHPSFVMFTLGNELGRNPAMFELVARFQEARSATPLRPRGEQHALATELCRRRRLLGDRQDRQDAARARLVLSGGFSRRRPHRQPSAFDLGRLQRFDRRRAGAGHRS